MSAFEEPILESSGIEAIVLSFCETHNIYRRYCGVLFRRAVERANQIVHSLQLSH